MAKSLPGTSQQGEHDANGSAGGLTSTSASVGLEVEDGGQGSRITPAVISTRPQSAVGTDSLDL